MERLSHNMVTVSFRIYAELNWFIDPTKRQQTFQQSCAGHATVKHMIEALGVPHTEVELILVNGQAADFSRRLRQADHVSVYPRFSRLAHGGALPGSQQKKGDCIFIADAHLGRLARDLRMLGFDVLYRNDLADADVADMAAKEERIVLTRDRDLLIRKAIVRGCYLYATSVDAQLREVMDRYRLVDRVRPLSRCLKCNGLLHPVEKERVQHRLPVRSGACGQHFFSCAGCDHLYWNGSHVIRMRQRIAAILGAPVVLET